MNLLETYSKRLAVAEKAYSKANAGQPLSEQKKLITARCLDNITKFLNEAFDNSVGTQRSDLGAYKRFALNLTTIAIPNLIAPDLVITYPMSSMAGYITYLEYVAGSNKGNTKQGDLFNGVFGLGDADPNYTSYKVITEKKANASAEQYSTTLNWLPVFPRTVDVIASVAEGGAAAGEFVDIPNADGLTGNLYAKTDVTNGVYTGAGGVKGTITYKTGAITINAATFDAAVTIDVNYAYDNVVIPQNDLPTLNAELKAIPLTAKARRIAIYYSQIAQFQAKQDYGFDLGQGLAEQAVGRLQYEIDTEVVKLLADNAAEDASLTWNRALPTGVSKTDHYEGFSEIISLAGVSIYNRTKRWMPNYMLIASDILPIIQMTRGWEAANVSGINGPYLAGTFNGLKTYVSPSMAAGEFVLGVNGNDAMTSAAVYAPYMPVVPTQLLQYADGGTSQGWSTMYDLKLLNASLLVKGKVIYDLAAQQGSTVYTHPNA